MHCYQLSICHHNPPRVNLHVGSRHHPWGREGVGHIPCPHVLKELKLLLVPCRRTLRWRQALTTGLNISWMVKDRPSCLLDHMVWESSWLLHVSWAALGQCLYLQYGVGTCITCASSFRLSSTSCTSGGWILRSWISDQLAWIIYRVVNAPEICSTKFFFLHSYI